MSVLTAKTYFKIDPRFLPKVKKATIDPLMRCGLLVEREAKRLLSVGGGATHRPSRAGKPPHLQTGNLRSAISTAKTSISKVIVGPTKSAPYGEYHEKGGEFGGRHYKPRPYMRPALRNTRKQYPKQFKNALKG